MELPPLLPVRNGGDGGDEDYFWVLHLLCHDFNFDEYQEVLYQAAHRLPSGVKVVVLADRGFIHTNVMGSMTAELGWHYPIRVKRNP